MLLLPGLVLVTRAPLLWRKLYHQSLQCPQEPHQGEPELMPRRRRLPCPRKRHAVQRR